MPRELPLPPPFLVGRENELAALTHLVGKQAGSRLVVVLSGLGGVGKSALALAWLRRLSDGFPDAHLYADLKGHGADGPEQPERILEQFLRSLGVPAAAMPGGSADQLALYRSLTANRRMLVLLDDATGSADVKALLPASTGSVVAVTSRRGLHGLIGEGAVHFAVPSLSADSGIALIERLAGQERVRAERDFATLVAAWCGGLPLALCVVGARLAQRPQLSLRTLTREVRDEEDGLGVLTVTDGPSLQSVFDASYRAVPADAMRFYRLVALHPGPEFSAEAASAVTGTTLRTARGLLDQLVDAHLVEHCAADRYRQHALLRVHARSRAEVTDSAAERTAADARVVHWYLATADAADRAVMPDRWRPRRPDPFDGGTGVPPRSFADSSTALEWLETERVNLVAAIRHSARRRPTAAWHLVDTMWALFLRRKHYYDWLDCHRVGLTAVRAAEDRRGEVLLLNHLGLGLTGLARYGEALDVFQSSLDIAVALGDRAAEASALNSVGLALQGLGRHREAVARFTDAALLQRESGERRGEALTRVNLGRAFLRAGLFADAVGQLSWAHDELKSLPDQYNAARALAALGLAQVRTGAEANGRRTLREAWQELGACGSRFEQAEVLEFLGDAARAAGEEDEARRSFEAALATFTELGSPRAEALTARLDTHTSG
ncbi:tetratricopeptide repeat protein [Streptomyces sp. NPDC091280]|uniref:tetratricopeptide repeat protein n=1 Tax=Streptomyces sp. NPDC091280 TaxID=3365984 RepID=UPI00382042D6